MAKPTKKRRMKITDIRWPGPDRGERQDRPPRKITPAIPERKLPYRIFTED